MKFRSVLAALCLFAAQPSAHASFSNLTILGDSLSDQGGFFATLATATGNAFAFPLPPYFFGRFSNGPVWTDYFTIARPDVTVTNRALAGALSGTYSTPIFGSVDNTADLTFANTAFAGLTAVTTGLDAQLASLGSVAGTNTAFALWIGANDINYAPFLGLADPADVVGTSLANVANAIDTLLGLGANDVFVANLPDLGLTPDGLSFGTSAQLTAATDAFNAGLNALAASRGPQVRIVDIHAAFDALLANAAALGFTDTTTACVNSFFGATACDDPASHVFWDGVHPTTGVHAMVAQTFNAAFTAPVPLPASGLMVLPGLALLALRRRPAA